MTFARWTARRAAAPGFLTLIVWLSGGCAVHHHHHYPPESQAPSEVPGAQVERSGTNTSRPRAEASPDVYDAALEPTAPSSEAAAEPVHPKNSPAPQAEPYPPAAPASNVVSVSAFSPFEGCAIDDDPTGWVVAECGEQRTILQTGAAARGPLERLFAYAGDTASGLQGESVSYWRPRVWAPSGCSACRMGSSIAGVVRPPLRR